MTRIEIKKRSGPSTSRRSAPTLALGALLAFATLSAPDLHAQAECEDVSGEWAVSVNLPDGNSQQVTLTLEQSECEITGLIEGNNQTPIDNGTVEGPTFTFVVNVTNQADGQGIEMTWEGTVDGDDLSGTFSADIMGTFPFTGTRADG
jgi:hypothetical protein